MGGSDGLSGRSQGAASSEVSRDPAVYEQQLSVVHALHQVLQVAGTEVLGSGGASGQGVHAACVAYVHAVQQALESNLEYMTEVRHLYWQSNA